MAAQDEPRRQAAAPEGVRGADLPGWAGWAAAAFAATVYHLLIDLHLGLFGEVSPEMSILKGLWGLAMSLLLAWWLLLVALAITGRRGALSSLLVVTAIEALVLNGVVAVIAAPPPSDAFPWQDISHFSALVAGAGASWLLWRERARGEDPSGGWLLITGTVALLVVANALGAPLNLEAIANPVS